LRISGYANDNGLLISILMAAFTVELIVFFLPFFLMQTFRYMWHEFYDLDGVAAGQPTVSKATK